MFIIILQEQDIYSPDSHTEDLCVVGVLEGVLSLGTPFLPSNAMVAQ